RRSDAPPRLCAAAPSHLLGGGVGGRDECNPVGRFTASSGTQGGRAGSSESRWHATSLPGRHARSRSDAPVARRILGGNAGGLQGSRRANGKKGTEFMMAEEIKSHGSDPNSVRKVVDVQAPPLVAWHVFTEQMGTWWPLRMYKIGKANAVEGISEPRVGGRWYERGDDGSTCDWGRVLVWEPPARLVLSWDITADWQYDPALQTEIEVRFIAEGNAATRVEL